MRTVIVFLLSSLCCLAQLTPDQKVSDFRALVDTYAKHYAPLQWKRDILHWDPLQASSWLDRAAKTKDDLDFYELCMEYVAALNDAHSTYAPPSSFEADLGFTVDIYDGRVLVDSIDRHLLPETKYPIHIGDELVSIDGKSAPELISWLMKYTASANTLSTRRSAAELIPWRAQEWIPRAHEIGTTADVKIKTSSGETAEYTMPWHKSGIPVTVLPPSAPVGTSSIRGIPEAARAKDAPWREWLSRFRRYALRSRRYAVGMGEREPIFALPDTFEQRLGIKRYDILYSGIYQASGYRIGFVRIPDFEYGSEDFQKELHTLDGLTDGLVVDVMRNPGGYACDAEQMASALFTGKFQLLGAEQVVSWSDILGLSYYLEMAREYAEDDEIAEIEMELREYQNAYFSGNARTKALPLCGVTLEGSGAIDKKGQPIGYTKPVLLLTDEMSASSAELFAAILQDNQRAKIFGMRTVGAGGSVDGFDAGIYSEGWAAVTMSLLIRKGNVKCSEFPAGPYVENIGIQPDIVQDYMTRDNLLNKGKNFVDAFTAAIVDHIKASAPTAP